MRVIFSWKSKHKIKRIRGLLQINVKDLKNLFPRNSNIKYNMYQMYKREIYVTSVDIGFSSENYDRLSHRKWREGMTKWSRLGIRTLCFSLQSGIPNWWRARCTFCTAEWACHNRPGPPQSKWHWYPSLTLSIRLSCSPLWFCARLKIY